MTKHYSVICLAQSRSILGDHIQHRLNIRRRAGDHAQNLARRRLLLQSFGKLAVAGIEFVEQPDVFDRDDGLVGEGLKQFDLRRSEGSHLQAPRFQFPDEFVLQTKRSRQVSCETR